MKHFITILISIYITSGAIAQDLIIKKNNTGEKAKILEVTSEYIRYKQFENLEGPDYNINLNDILVIVYENGHWQSFYENQISTSKNLSNDQEDEKQTKAGKYGRRSLRQLGYVAMYRESTSNYENASRYGINYSIGHIKDERALGFLFELGLNMFKQGFYEDDEKVLDNYNLMLTFLFGTIVKIYKTDKLLIYAKLAGGGVGTASVIKEPEDSFGYNDYKLEYNYNLAAGVNYKLAKKFGLYIEGGYSRVQLLQGGISFMID